MRDRATHDSAARPVRFQVTKSTDATRRLRAATGDFLEIRLSPEPRLLVVRVSDLTEEEQAAFVEALNQEALEVMRTPSSPYAPSYASSPPLRLLP